MQQLLDDRRVMIANVNKCRYVLQATDADGDLCLGAEANKVRVDQLGCGGGS